MADPTGLRVWSIVLGIAAGLWLVAAVASAADLAAPPDSASEPARESATFRSPGMPPPTISAKDLGLTESTPSPEPGVENPAPPPKALYPPWTERAPDQPFDPQAQASGETMGGFQAR